VLIEGSDHAVLTGDEPRRAAEVLACVLLAHVEVGGELEMTVIIKSRRYTLALPEA
jgi:hypothetical protein